MIIDLPILESIKDSQMQHGLKYENYQRYTSYCSRRLHRLRRSLNVHQGIASSAKARHQRARKLTDISNSMVIEAGEKDHEYGERMLMIQLFLAERAWSHSMLLKQESVEQPRKRYHLVKRLRKASEYAEKFEKLVNDPEGPSTERTKDEAVAYSSYIRGMYKVERKDWLEAKEQLLKALTIYFKLSVCIIKPEVLEHYRQRIEEIRASLKYCEFNLGHQVKKLQIKVSLPSNIQFHDIAHKHALKELEAAQDKKASQPVSVSPVAKPDEPSQMSSAKPSPLKKAEKSQSVEDDDDQFEETQEGNDEEEEISEEEDSDSDDDEKEKESRVGGVTGLVKNWLGGAWS